MPRSHVLVLGAGASIDFGFPSGLALVQAIIKRTGFDNQRLLSAIHGTGLREEDVRRFSEELMRSGTMSVDEFLGSRADMVPAGKKLIAASLSQFEHESYIYNGQVSPSWLQVLSQRIGASLEAWEAVRLKVITFNYDRVLESFLLNSLVSRYSMTWEDAASFLKERIEILHVHGQMGSLYGIGPGKPRFFTPIKENAELLAAAEGIKIVHEGKDDDPEFTQAKSWLEAATNITFLGFGYGRDNMRRLGAHGLLKGKTVLGTCIGMTDREQKDAKRLASDSIRLVNVANLTELLRTERVLVG